VSIESNDIPGIGPSDEFIAGAVNALLPAPKTFGLQPGNVMCAPRKGGLRRKQSMAQAAIRSNSSQHPRTNSSTSPRDSIPKKVMRPRFKKLDMEPAANPTSRSIAVSRRNEVDQGLRPKRLPSDAAKQSNLGLSRYKSMVMNKVLDSKLLGQGSRQEPVDGGSSPLDDEFDLSFSIAKRPKTTPLLQQPNPCYSQRARLETWNRHKWL